MTRVYCTKCQRLENLCLCNVLPVLANKVELVFLQHPLEQRHIKSTAWLTHASLTNSQLLVGETFSDDDLSFLKDDKQTFLLYPKTDEEEVVIYTTKAVRETFDLSSCRVVVLDGTWKKTRKMLFLNPVLAELPRIAISPDAPSNYAIRKQKNLASLSTLEATQALLVELEQNLMYKALDEVLAAIQSQYLHFAKTSTAKDSEHE